MKKTTEFTFSLTYLHAVSGGDKTFEKMVLLGAVDDIQLQITQLEKAWRNKDGEKIRRIAHALKSVVAIAGITELEMNCKKLDQLFTDEEFHIEGSSYLNKIIYGWMNTRPALEEMIAQMYQQ
jgi:HPt (histidine-containing phosphotransfer) domain-containing protein